MEEIKTWLAWTIVTITSGGVLSGLYFILKELTGGFSKESLKVIAFLIFVGSFFYGLGWAITYLFPNVK